MRWHSMNWRLPFLKGKKTRSVIEVRVDQEKCRGCLLCIKSAPSVFRLSETGKAQVISVSSGLDEELLKKIIRACPACAIMEK